MKYIKPLLILLILLLASAGAFYAGTKYVLGKVKQGAIDNYPTFKNIVQSADIEVDTLIVLNITPDDDRALYNLLNNGPANLPVEVTIPYYGRYGIDLSVRHYRIFVNDDGELEIWLPAVSQKYCEVKFEGILVNGKPANLYGKPDVMQARKAVYNYLLPELSKHRQHKKDAALSVTKALMYYIIPMQYQLKLYINSQQQQLPLLPGVNQSIDDAIKSSLDIK